MTVQVPAEGFDIDSFNDSLESSFDRYGDRFDISVTPSEENLVIKNSWDFYGETQRSEDVLLRFKTYFDIHESAGSVYLYSASKKDAIGKSRGYAINKGVIVGEHRLDWVATA